MGYLPGMGANTHVRVFFPFHYQTSTYSGALPRNSTAPRLASSSKDGTVRVWSTLTRLSEYTLGGHTASVNVVRWGGGGLDGKGVLYTASSDRTVRVWDANGVSFSYCLCINHYSYTFGVGQIAAYAERPCPLGNNAGPQHRLCVTYRTLRSPRQETCFRRRGYVRYSLCHPPGH